MGRRGAVLMAAVVLGAAPWVATTAGAAPGAVHAESRDDMPRGFPTEMPLPEDFDLVSKQSSTGKTMVDAPTADGCVVFVTDQPAKKLVRAYRSQLERLGETVEVSIPIENVLGKAELFQLEFTLGFPGADSAGLPVMVGLNQEVWITSGRSTSLRPETYISVQCRIPKPPRDRDRSLVIISFQSEAQPGDAKTLGEPAKHEIWVQDVKRPWDDDEITVAELRKLVGFAPGTPIIEYHRDTGKQREVTGTIKIKSSREWLSNVVFATPEYIEERLEF